MNDSESFVYRTETASTMRSGTAQLLQLASHTTLATAEGSLELLDVLVTASACHGQGRRCCQRNRFQRLERYRAY